MSDAQTIIEKAARALRERCKYTKSVVHGDDATGWKYYADDVRAILEAISQPEEAVTLAGANAIRQDGKFLGTMEADLIWQAMLNEAVKAEK